MNKKRLLKLADFLETIPAKSFDLGGWVISEAIKPEGKCPGTCGFAGCAMGWAAHAKLFRGLRLEDGEPLYAGKPGWDAIEVLFDTEHLHNSRMFSSGQYPDGCSTTPKQVARRIRKFVETGGVPNV